jgi:hypothetical protein
LQGPAVTRTYSSRPPRGRKIPQITEHSVNFRPVLVSSNAVENVRFGSKADITP